MPDENWTPSDTYPAPLYFHCPNTMCDGHVKLKNRAQRHFVRCEKCGLDFSIGADSTIARLANAAPTWLSHIGVALIALLVGPLLGQAMR